MLPPGLERDFSWIVTDILSGLHVAQRPTLMWPIKPVL